MSEKLILKNENIENYNHKNSVKTENKTDNNLFIPILILAISLYLRLSGINFGLPYILEPEESKNLLTAISPLKSLFSFNSLETSVLFNFLSTLIILFSSGTLDINSLTNVIEVNPYSLYFPLRILSTLFALGSILIVYFIGRSFNKTAGIISSGLLSVSFLHVKYSQMFMPFSSLTFCTLLCSYFLVRSVVQEKSNLFFIIAGISAFLSMTFNVFGIVNLVPILFYLKKTNKVYFHSKVLIGIFLLLLLLINPSIVLQAFDFIKYFVVNYITGYYNFPSSSYLLYSYRIPLQGIGPVAYLSVFFLLFKHEQFSSKALAVLFSFPLMFISVLGLLHISKIGYGTVIVPYFCISAGLVLADLFHQKKSEANKLIFIILCIFAFWIPLKYSLRYNKIMDLSDTRVIATDWISEKASGDVKITRDKNTIQNNWFYAYDKSRLEKAGIDPDLLVDRSEFLIDSHLLRKKDWFKILKKKVAFVIIDSIDSEKVLRQPDSKLMKKYYSKFSRRKPEIPFNPYLMEYDKKINSSLIEDLYSPFETLWQRERPGPVIKIYKL